MNRNSKDLTLTAMFLALGLVLPFLTGQIPQIGNMLLPMHIPVFLCGLICGWKYGAILGFILPILRNAGTLLAAVGDGVAVSNADDDAVRAARHRTCSNNEAGVGRYIARHYEKED